MFERFTYRARQVMVLAQDEARSLNHSYIGTEHLLLALIRETEGVAGQVFQTTGPTLAAARAHIVRQVGLGKEPVSGDFPLTLRARRVLDLSLREALKLGHDHIGTEHFLLGLLALGREQDSDPQAIAALKGLGVDLGLVHDRVVARFTVRVHEDLLDALVVHVGGVPRELFALRDEHGGQSAVYRGALADFLERYAERLRTEIMV